MSLVQLLIDATALGAVLALVAMGIALVFGVMRLVNFAYGELITVGAYTLMLTKGWPIVLRVLASFGVVIALSLLMELVFRPLRRATAATMLVATFAVSFLLQNMFLLIFGPQGETIEFLAPLNRAIEIGDLRIRWITIVAIVLGAALLGFMAWLLGKTSVGLQMRAAAADFDTARILGVRAGRVIALAFVLAGFLAAAVTLVLAVQRPLATPTYGFFILVPALVGVVVGGLGKLVPATLGGFGIGFMTVILGDVLPSGSRVFLNSVLFAIVIIVLLVRPDGLFIGRTGVAERV
ncbi:MAG: branched-chain amino acid ABC transporter permease [Acidimicrobiia bacterium]|nr:MAG: branched-chain amino acid ABC transporter permease [Acidimicrobiia bacterium]